MKNVRLLAVGMCVLLVLVLVSSFPACTSKPVEVIRLNLSHCMSAASNPQKLYEYYADKIYERTNGRVLITVYPSGVLTPPGQHFEAAKSGVVDIVHHSLPYTPGMFPVVDISLPLPAENVWVYAHAAADFASQFKLGEVQELADVHFLGYTAFTGPYYIVTCDKPVLSTEDLEGLNLRAIGSQMDVVKAWGGTPVSVPMGEVFDALSKGVIDGGLLPAEALKGYKFADVVKYLTPPPRIWYNIGMLVMNLETWNSLSKDIQDVFTETAEDLLEWDARVWWYNDLDGMQYFLSLPGREVLEVPSGEQAAWVAGAMPAMDTYIAGVSALGLPGADYIEYLEDRCEYWNGHQIDDQTCIDWVETEVLEK
jgi:TRAP-type C4-dicarboxylate transport system substrate-binding protein